MQDRLTFLCLDCGLRQSGATECRQCASRDLADLADGSTRESSLRVREQRYRKARAHALARMTPSARRAWLAFAAGAAVAGTPLVALGFIVGAAPAIGVGAVVVSAGAGIGALWRHVSPRSLVSGLERDRIDTEVDSLVQNLPMPLPARPAITGADVVTRAGWLRAEPRDALFEAGALALRLVIADERHPLDDAWICDAATWTLVTDDGGEMAVSMAEGVQLDALPADPLRIEHLDDAQVEFLRARGRRVSRGDGLGLQVARLRDGARVKITGHLVDRNVPEGYRGTKTVGAIAGPLRIGWSPNAVSPRPRQALPSPDAP